jgi:hypothetical protein
MLCAADLRSQLLESQNRARLEVSAARCEAQDLSSQLQESQRQLGNLQQQLADSAGQQEALRGSVKQLAAAAEPGLSAKVQSEARWVNNAWQQRPSRRVCCKNNNHKKHVFTSSNCGLTLCYESASSHAVLLVGELHPFARVQMYAAGAAVRTAAAAAV